MFSDPLVSELASFVRSIGIDVLAASSLLPTTFPGLDIQSGRVLVDETRVVYPGDILHEAGHLAVSHPNVRGAARLDPNGGEELAALAWSYAAAAHLQIDPSIVFYPSSYHGIGERLVENFAVGQYIGVPLLQSFGMTAEPKHAVARGVPPFPRMTRWLR